jgi:hypothetical protein
MNVWPSTLPQFVLRDGYQSGTGDGRLRSQTDAGIAKLRRRFSAVPRPLSARAHLSASQLEVFKTFVHDTLKEGSLPFQLPSPEGGDPLIVQFGQNMPTWVPQGVDWIVSLDLAILP